MTAQLWQRYQDWLFYHKDLDLYLDISRMRFDDAFVEKIAPKFDFAFAEMAALEAGKIANPDENRMVGHYWLRAPELAPTQELRQEIADTLELTDDFVQKVHSGLIKPPNAPKFTEVLSIGIGGSALGPQFVAEALGEIDAPMNIHFMDNTDPAGFDKVLSQLRDRLDRTLVITISKSGGTPESRNGMLEARNAFELAGLDFSKHAVAITMPGSKLDNVAKTDGWLAMIPMYDWVGGRTSELSAVGLLPAELQGINVREMLEGARLMDIATRKQSLKENPAALLAMSWYYAGNGKGDKDMVMLPYKDSLLLFSRYLQQLVMESIGKQFDLDGNPVYQGIAVYGNKGTTDQHAYVQQLREGVPNFFITFIEVLKDRNGGSIEVEPGVTSGDYLSGLLQGTRSAIYENNRDSITLTIPEVTPAIVGSLIALYERAVGLYGFLVNINAYHQPGVEAGKKAAAQVLNLQSRVVEVLQSHSTPLPIADLATKAGAPDQIEMVYKILRHLANNDPRVVLHGELGHPGQLTASMS
ncbi:glucose-6-phosphate isomerase [filamentous cyanobacterium LEGE 11480]|uniref:Glucose-6-phosphate isomerase n=2 Tax=Romeriopsis TaxID=2992131 RepID=A0A928VM72_9CYAN|nr:glucose-6-phosphate isomerase [Romeriopsis navalis LEGE 11480]